ncbi:hypothetical protein HYC85_008518 [Camellia sinensis]|uniref:Uncharacterized protein n=1 Tax=Camellia sinensis TaxID=4442 RepID=A0A7J7HS20_CAMSI|nr:hypothetical protein HYC85_008518 [Camellia sinensis]
MPHLQMLEPKIRMDERNSVSITLWKGTLLQHRAFSMFGVKGKYIISGGNDKLVKVWDWSRYLDATQTSSNSDLLHLSISLSMKFLTTHLVYLVRSNWLCTTLVDSDNLIVCDTSKVVKVYTVV